MRATNLILMSILSVALLSGCRNQETALTGAYGRAVVAGQVVLQGGGNPAGVEVTVLGTGMQMEVGQDGRFAFSGVPESAELQFQRADGIGSSLRVEGTSTNLVVELAGTAATGRRRGVGRTLQYEGLVREVGTATIKVYTSHKEEVEFAVDGSTMIRKGNQTFLLADIQPDWRVHVKAESKSGVLTALEIKVQNTNDGDDDGDGDGPTMTANGPVTQKNGSDLTVDSQPKGPVTVRTDANTIIKKQGARITVDEIQVGDEINAQGARGADDILLARQIEVRGNSKKPKR